METLIQFPRTCGTCADFTAYFRETEQLLSALGAVGNVLAASLEETKTCPACTDYRGKE